MLSSNSRKNLSERDICSKFITPAIIKAGWDLESQVREEKTFSYCKANKDFTDGRIIVKGDKLIARGKRKRADYILYYKNNLPIAIIEAKDNKHSVGDGIQQALNYGKILDIPFVYSSNGDTFLEHDMTTGLEREIPLEEFPSPQELWHRYRVFKGITDNRTEEIILQDYYSDNKIYSPRYFQEIAINKTVEAIAKGQDRILLVMATGTGKTYTAFQIIWRLWKSKAKKRILFLADRNILVDQTILGDFAPFKGAMTKITNREVNKAYEIYLALYQGVTGTEEEKNIYKQFLPDFFDLVIIDECHRGSADENSAWRDILEYFSSATQIGLTATPKETKDVSNSHYFGEPIYQYSLKQGIQDGFLAPYKVIRPMIDIDEGWRPEEGQLDRYGNLIPDEEYNVKDFDKKIIIDERTQLVAKRVSEFLKNTDRFAKTIVFCERTDHAERMRQALNNENSDLTQINPKYVMRITGDDEEGKAELSKFTHPEENYPVIATTSKLLTTGVDTKTVKVIVLDSNISSMTEFKQIIGRGTRLNPKFGKNYFTIIDFRNVTRHFEDKAFDGNPVQIYEPKENQPMEFPEEDIDFCKTDYQGENQDYNEINDVEEVLYMAQDVSIEDCENETIKKYYVDNVKPKIIGEKKSYYGKDGKLITESIKDYTKKTLQQDFMELKDFLKRWNGSSKKKAVIDELAENGIIWEALQEEVGKDLDPFDLICHVAFDMPALTRKERANKVKKRNYFAKYGDKARVVLEALLEKYADLGIENIEDNNILKLHPFDSFGSVVEIIKLFGGREQFQDALMELENQLYEVNLNA